MNETEFNQAIERGAKDVARIWWPDFGWEHLGQSSRDRAIEAARAALLAVLQPKACPECGGRGEVGSTSAEVYGVPGADFVATGPCESCGGHFPDTVGSGASNDPPTLFRAMSEPVVVGPTGLLFVRVYNSYEELERLPSNEPVYRYAPPSTRSTT